MCMKYKGVDYHYAFEFTFPVCYNLHGETFRIVITDYMEEIQGYSGLCLENELFVVSENTKIEFSAFIDIINEVVDITTSSVMSYAETHNGCFPTPHRKVDDADFVEKFNKAKESSESKYYQELLDKHYDELKKYFYNPDLITKETYSMLEPDAKYCLTAFLLRLYIYTKLPQIKGFKIFKI